MEGSSRREGREDTRHLACGHRDTGVNARVSDGFRPTPETPGPPRALPAAESRQHTTVYKGQTPRPHAARRPSGPTARSATWSGLCTRGQLSQWSPTPSPSVSLWSVLYTYGQLSRSLNTSVGDPGKDKRAFPTALSNSEPNVHLTTRI